MTEARQKLEKVTQNAFDRTNHAEWCAPGADKSSKCKCSNEFFQFWSAARSPKMAPEVKIPHIMSENQNFNGQLKRNRDEPKGQKSDKC